MTGLSFDFESQPIRCAAVVLSAVLTAASGCSGGGGAASPDAGTSPDSGPDFRRRAEVSHKFEGYELPAGAEKQPCVQWTLHNEKPLYVNTVTLANEGGFHHSNWYVVPEDYAAGKDGYFDCESRGFAEVTAATQGTVLFAQSTQAKEESQSFPDGVVVKIPADHKIVADLHLLNAAPRKRSPSMRMTLDVIHPRLVETVATPFRLTYHDLQIPPKSRSRFTSTCTIGKAHEDAAGESFDAKLYYILPHYHELGSYFSVRLAGGPRDGKQIFELSGFNAEANGRTYKPPVDLSGTEGLTFTCGYDNPTDRTVGWGLGGSEMCVMLGFADLDYLMGATVSEGRRVGRNDAGIVMNRGPCKIRTFPESETMGEPTEAEKQGELYVPETDADQLDPVPDCTDVDGTAKPFVEPTLTALKNQVFTVSCSYSSCHGSETPVAGLSLEGDNLHAELMNHELQTPADVPIVKPGDPANSWLYRVTSSCDPSLPGGETVSHMPRNSPTLLDPKLVAMIREWIERGAKNN